MHFRCTGGTTFPEVIPVALRGAGFVAKSGCRTVRVSTTLDGRGQVGADPFGPVLAESKWSGSAATAADVPEQASWFPRRRVTEKLWLCRRDVDADRYALDAVIWDRLHQVETDMAVPCGVAR